MLISVIESCGLVFLQIACSHTRCSASMDRPHRDQLLINLFRSASSRRSLMADFFFFFESLRHSREGEELEKEERLEKTIFSSLEITHALLGIQLFDPIYRWARY